ncbi:transporter [Thiohalorhabdus sp. Cl-TMA]|uniref:Transporter n=1 Tax=Thiohalorhabdus methylotrophus TaxID=3242694 RepID=A0ABV4TW80_9GAMM
MIPHRILAAGAALWPALAGAHHGVASLGAIGLEGPGAPIETSSSQTLPEGSALAYMKLDRAEYERKTAARDDELEYAEFWLFGLGYGFTPYLSGYVFLPKHDKVVEDNSYNTAGFADISLMAVLGFKYDEGFRLVPERESLADLEDWHFTVYGGGTLPTGDPNTRDASGNIDPGMSLSFGEPSLTVGATATKALGLRLTWVAETSYIHFRPHTYADGQRVQFGSELRVNSAFSYRLLSFPERRFRLDANLEAQFLRLGRDEVDGEPEAATGGDMLYALPGVRAYADALSIGAGLKVPVWTALNEEERQQGGEGSEKYRVIVTFSALF